MPRDQNFTALFKKSKRVCPKRRCHFLILTDKWYKMQRVGIILT